MPVTAVIARSSLNIKLKANSRLPALVQSAFVFGSLALYSDVISAVPLSALAGVLISSGSADTYSTLEPQAAYHKRITFCLNLHNDAVKAMSYPPDAHKGDLPDADAIKERQREEQELAEALAEEDEF
mmetsp:Transcript_2438/g.7462  ORF Transcript_2438/g.7462 Transcript_2438/m.7462 type:complete len:128 (-) Transcript_2438:327-710(-)